MRSRTAILAFALAALAAPFVHAQYSVGSYPCGPASTTLISCNGLPVSLNGVSQGTAWLNAQLSPTSTSPSFIIWQGGLSLVPQANIGKVVCSTMETFTSGTHTTTQCTFLTVYFSGGDQADQTYYTGNGTFHFHYDYNGYGRNAHWDRTEKAGALKLVFY